MKWIHNTHNALFLSAAFTESHKGFEWARKKGRKKNLTTVDLIQLYWNVISALLPPLTELQFCSLFLRLSLAFFMKRNKKTPSAPPRRVWDHRLTRTDNKFSQFLLMGCSVTSVWWWEENLWWRKPFCCQLVHKKGISTEDLNLLDLYCIL